MSDAVFCDQWMRRFQEVEGDAVIVRDSGRDYETFEHFLKLIQERIPSGIPIICNHRYQTLLPGTQGVHHKRGNSRMLGLSEGFAGISAHSTEGCRNAERNGFDYVFLSPIFSTSSHPGENGLGLDKLSRICASVHIPVFALGGITQENRKACFVSGASGTASISLFMPD